MLMGLAFGVPAAWRAAPIHQVQTALKLLELKKLTFIPLKNMMQFLFNFTH